MNLITSHDRSSLRRAQLTSAMKEAIELKNDELFFALQAKCVHRYGLSFLNDFKDSGFSAYSKNNCQLNQSDKLIRGDLDLKNSDGEHSLDVEKEELLIGETSTDNSNNGVKISCETDLREDSGDSQSKFPEVISPPPPPSISHLRKWLAVNEEEVPKAS